MKKIFSFIALITCSLVIFTGCKADSNEAGNPNKLTLIAHIDSAAPEGKVFMDSVNMFKKEYPEIEIIVETAYNDPFHQKIAAMAASNTLPDMIYMWPGGRSSQLMENNKVQNLYPFLENDSIKNRLVKQAKLPQHDGKLYELPSALTTTHVFYANKGLLKKHNLEMPKNYDDLVKMVPVLKAKGIETVLMSTKDSWTSQSCFFSMIVGRIAGNKWLKKAISGNAKFTDKPFIDSLKFFTKVFKDNVISKDSIMVTYGEVPNLFATGKAAFLIDGDWRVNALSPLLKGKKIDNFELGIFPIIPGEKYPNSTSQVVGCGFGMNANLTGEKAEKAWKWIKFFADTKASDDRIKKQGLVPAVKLDVSKYKLTKIVKERLAMPTKYAGSYVLDNVISSEKVNVLNTELQQLIIGATTPEKVAEKIEKVMRK